MMYGNRRKSTSDAVLASTAGEDSWKTWAGRSQGSEGFEFWDLLRGAKRKFNSKFVWSIPPSGTPCPVCMTPPTDKSEWHITSACGHAVCKDCLTMYASSLVRDPAHHGPLKCPVCPLPLRPKDAIMALSGDAQLLQLWDQKIRDEVLRALPGYRHCPHCNNNNNNNTQNDDNDDDDTPTTTTGLAGGGYVTPECLAPINKQREQEALKWLNHPIMTQKGFAYLCLLYILLYCGRFHSTDFFVNLINVSVVPMWFLKRIWRLVKHIIAHEARKTLFAPIAVECPCCQQSFILNAEAELGNNVITDEATQKWIGSNTRPCPSCSVPISKIEGCNHMQCAHCRARFCWACMRVGSACAAFNCHHGAPYGNAGTDQGEQSTANNEEGGILDRIDSIARESTRLDGSDVVTFCGIAMSIVARENPSVKLLARFLVTTFALVFSSGTVTTVVLAFVVGVAMRDQRVWLANRRGERLDQEEDEIMDGSHINRAIRRGSAAVRNSIRMTTGELANELFDVDGAVERGLVDEAIRRSLEEQ
ncbi:IBR domain-containing protein 1 [Seminavis robusta]|uniref:IBR domain-containing protein 1 n=1 Tax=Seminavis robusta TaxID=568900 RepID=A0A9N8E4A9_9STRA|nr:IBR domain-containing protein 1 [Seminavis robusta]|eukprot:Sro487_g152880.1 IBR domain-containing protein 1 (533) ;mRNA; f:31632-33321